MTAFHNRPLILPAKYYSGGLSVASKSQKKKKNPEECKFINLAVRAVPKYNFASHFIDAWAHLRNRTHVPIS